MSFDQTHVDGAEFNSYLWILKFKFSMWVFCNYKNAYPFSPIPSLKCCINRFWIYDHEIPRTRNSSLPLSLLGCSKEAQIMANNEIAYTRNNETAEQIERKYFNAAKNVKEWP